MTAGEETIRRRMNVNEAGDMVRASRRVTRRRRTFRNVVVEHRAGISMVGVKFATREPGMVMNKRQNINGGTISLSGRVGERHRILPASGIANGTERGGRLTRKDVT